MDLVINERLALPSASLSWTAVTAGGPGGQNVNKVASKVELRFDLANDTTLNADVRERLQQIAKTHLTRDGVILITSALTRDQQKNLADARAKLARLVQAALVRPKRRVATKPSRGAKERRIKEKKQRSDRLTSRRIDS